MIATLKAKLIAGGLVALGILLTIIKVLTKSNSNLRHKVEQKEAVIHHTKTVIKKDREREQRTESRRAEARNEIKDTGSSDAFANPNSLRRKRNDSSD